MGRNGIDVEAAGWKGRKWVGLGMDFGCLDGSLSLVSRSS